MNEVVKFIKNRFRQEDQWLSGNCLWFSLILKKRFPGGRIYYLPVPGHFIYKYKGKFYDWTGEIVPVEKMILFSKLKEVDPDWYDRLINNCLK